MEIRDLLGLEHLWLSNNYLTGPILVETGNLESSRRLDLKNNSLSGIITAVERFTKLQILEPSENTFPGQIPDLQNLVRLTTLELSSNKFL